MIELDNVTKVYEDNGVKALYNVSLKIKQGEFAFICGTSGSGKSTLLKLLLKEEDVTSGKIYINNKDITTLNRKYIPYLRREIGMVFQDFRLFENKTVYENVAFAMKITDTPNRKIRRLVPVALKLVGLENKARSFPRQLSGGEKQRVAIARAIINKPSILICDEPTGNLDPETSWEIMSLLEQINKKNTTVLMVTHAENIVNQMRKRTIIIDHGRIVNDVPGGDFND
ncbi:MAG: cell division ATP-binding protein FtsE [Clostridia bacterium]|nr:cell division ATP-binding protein FtsE [Clostridia bacterium]